MKQMRYIFVRGTLDKKSSYLSRMRIAIVGALFCGMVIMGCTRSHQASPHDKTFSANDLGKNGVPKLTVIQQRELGSVLNKLPGPKRKRIRFVFSGPEGAPKTSFYVLDRERWMSAGGGVEAYRVLNASCNTFYDPVNDYEFVGTSCGIDPDVTG